jgi:hypothetical protein
MQTSRTGGQDKPEDHQHRHGGVRILDAPLARRQNSSRVGKHERDHAAEENQPEDE